MQMLFVIGRLLFTMIFIISGTQKLMDVAGTAAIIAPRIAIPDLLSGVTVQIEAVTGMTTPQLLAILSGVIELVGGLLIAFNIATSGMALLLALFTAMTTYYFHDFWNMAGAAREANLIHALKNLSIFGALLVFMAIGSTRPVEADRVREI